MQKKVNKEKWRQLDKISNCAFKKFRDEFESVSTGYP